MGEGDKITDTHGVTSLDFDKFKDALKTMKDSSDQMIQTYESGPGVAIGKYRIRRTVKPDGSKWVEKTKI